MSFLQREIHFPPIMSGSETAIKNKLKIRTFPKRRENGLGEGLGWKQVCVFFSRTLLQPTTEESICGSFQFPVFTSVMLIRA